MPEGHALQGQQNVSLCHLVHSATLIFVWYVDAKFQRVPSFTQSPSVVATPNLSLLGNNTPRTASAAQATVICSAIPTVLYIP